jgi:hypothetical protein
MSEVPSEVFRVLRFDKQWVTYSDRPESKVFLVRSTTTPIKVNLWRTEEGYVELKKLYPGLPDFNEDAWHGGFVNGRPLLELSVPVCTCAGSERPPILYRVVHEQQPYYGMKARGYGRVKVTLEFSRP